MRPFVLTIRLRMVAILIVTVEGIFHYWSVSVRDMCLSSQVSRYEYWLRGLLPKTLFRIIK